MRVTVLTRQRLVDADLDLRADGDSTMTDDNSRVLSSMADKIDNGLRQGLCDVDQASALALQLMEENMTVSFRLACLRDPDSLTCPGHPRDRPTA